MTMKLTTSSISSHFGIGATRINQDLNAGFLVDCLPPVRMGKKRVWDEHAYIAAYFYFELCYRGASRISASKTATAIAMFYKRNPDQRFCCVIARKNSSDIVAVALTDCAHPKNWGSDHQWGSFYNVGAAKDSFDKLTA